MIKRIETAFANHPLWVASCLFAFTLITVVAVMSRMPEMFDDGIILTNAMRVLEGEIPHRDFYSNYGPGQFYAVAATMAVFGTDLFVGRFYGAVMMALCVALGYAVLARHVRPFIGIFVALAAALWVIGTRFHVYPIFPPLVFAFISVLLLMRPNAFAERWPVLLAGGCAGIIALFRYDTGFFVLLAQVLFILIAASRQGAQKERIQRAIVFSMIAAIGSGLTFFPFAISFLLVAPLDVFLRDIVEISGVYGEMRGLPFPGFGAIIERLAAVGVYFPFLVSLVALVDIIRDRHHLRANVGASEEQRRLLLEIFLLLLTAILIYKGVVRVSVVHFMLAIIPGTFLAGIVAHKWLAGSNTFRIGAIALLAVTMVPAAFFGSVPIRSSLHEPSKTTAFWLAGMDDPRITCPQPNATAMTDDYGRIVRYLKAHVPQDERIFVGLPQHSRVLMNSMAIYAASERLPATMWAQFDPGVQNTRPVQAEMIEELKSNDVRFVVRDAHFETFREPNGSAIGSGAHLLDDYLKAQYRPVASAGEIEVWLRNDQPAPATGEGADCMPAPIG